MQIDFAKSGGVVPAIVQDAITQKVLMLGYMSAEAYKKTIETKLVTFFSRSRNALWTKGDTSGNYLKLVDIKLDCDADTLLVLATPTGPVCHTGADTCFNTVNMPNALFLQYLQDEVIRKNKNGNIDESYTAKMFAKGINKLAQKVGEEAVELVIEAKDNNLKLFVNEAADLMFHYLMLLEAKNVSLTDVLNELHHRHVNRESNKEKNK